MSRFDLCLAWTWEGDEELRRRLGAAMASAELRLLEIAPENRDAVLAELAAGVTSFGLLLDRASDADEAFLPVVEWARAAGARRVNPRERAVPAWDKGAMHELLCAELHTPATVVLPPSSAGPQDPDLGGLAPPWCVKPVHGGGGDGVVVGARDLEAVTAARRQVPDDGFLVQAHVEPVTLGGRPAWFRNLYSCGHVYACWWDPASHVYEPVSAAEANHFELQPLAVVMRAVARLSGMHLFSSEVALTAEERFVVVDYLNDPVDLRPQSAATEGVPDALLDLVVADLVALAGSTAPPR